MRLLKLVNSLRFYLFCATKKKGIPKKDGIIVVHVSGTVITASVMAHI